MKSKPIENYTRLSNFTFFLSWKYSYIIHKDCLKNMTICNQIAYSVCCSSTYAVSLPIIPITTKVILNFFLEKSNYTLFKAPLDLTCYSPLACYQKGRPQCPWMLRRWKIQLAIHPIRQIWCHCPRSRCLHHTYCIPGSSFLDTPQKHRRKLEGKMHNPLVITRPPFSFLPSFLSLALFL